MTSYSYKLGLGTLTRYYRVNAFINSRRQLFYRALTLLLTHALDQIMGEKRREGHLEQYRLWVSVITRLDQWQPRMTLRAERRSRGPEKKRAG